MFNIGDIIYVKKIQDSEYELKKPFFNCDDIETKIKKLELVIKILVDCANFKYKGNKIYLKQVVNDLY